MEPVRVITLTVEEFEAITGRIIAEAEKRVEDAVRRATDKEFLTVAEAAEMLGLSERAIHYRLNERAIPFTKRGRTIRIRTRDLREYMAEGSIKPRRKARG
jgi:excisionase family DNA binding protein